MFSSGSKLGCIFLQISFRREVSSSQIEEPQEVSGALLYYTCISKHASNVFGIQVPGRYFFWARRSSKVKFSGLYRIFSALDACYDDKR